MRRAEGTHAAAQDPVGGSLHDAELTEADSPAPSPASALGTSHPARLPALTVLRGAAATAVVLYHIDGGVFAAIDLPRWLPFIGRLYLGVDLFFILSGFILAHVHGAEFERFTPRAAGHFYILRLARIYPVHATMMAAYLGLFLLQHAAGPGLGIGLRGRAAHYTASSFVEHLLLVEPYRATWNFPAWSVSAEWFAYLWFPLLAATVLRLPAKWCAGLLAAVMAGFAVVFVASFDRSLDQMGLGRVCFEFVAGCLAYRTSVGLPWRRLVAIATPALALAGILAAIPSWSDFGWLLIIGMLIVASGHPEARAPRWLLAPPRQALGEISYSLYICQALVFATIGRAMQALLPHLRPTAQLALVPALLGVAIFSAAVLHRFVEQPARGWMRSWLVGTARSARQRLQLMRA